MSQMGEVIMYPKILVMSYKVSSDKMGEDYNFQGVEFNLITQDYAESISAAGAIPLLMPYLEARQNDEAYIREFLNLADGVVLPGGSDIDPALYGSYPQKNLGSITPERDRWELKILKIAKEMGKPILGICRGFQLINVFYGGSLKVDVCGNSVETKIPHMASMVPKYYKTHKLNIKPGTRLAEVFAASEIAVNSFHHQAVDKVGNNLKVSAVAPDGFVEGIEDSDYPYLVGVQWHPEMMATREPVQLKLFEDFVQFIIKNK